MHDQFEVTSFLQKSIASSQSGRVHIIGKDVEWCLDIVDGQLLFAAHSLQYLTALETVLPSLGYEAALSVYWRLARSDSYKRQSGDQGLEALNWTCKVVAALVRYEALSLEQAENTLAKLAEDAVESLLGLDAATVNWYPMPKDLWHVNTQGVDISALIDRLLARLKLWQSVCDRIISPHQRPYCENTSDLYQEVPQGILPHQMLTALARLMQGASIRQLAQAVKQDEAKLAKLLYPYIRHRVIKLWPPVQPLDRLPWIPQTKQPSDMTSSVATVRQSETAGLVVHAPSSASSGLVVKKASSVGSGLVTNHRLSSNTRSIIKQQSGSNSLGKRSSIEPKTRHLIICIDDSQAMLEKIDSYLDPEHFELKTIIDPVASVSKICVMKPDLVLMDVSMPSINGNSLCQILKRSYMFKDVPIIMISSNASPLNKATAQSSGATDYLEKPFSKAQLMRVLETYLEIKRSF
ncbi:response regulator [Leptothoe spongobia]|uniref:Response regulator n=1 Tax=Leptothoe spongobia TAU-MAC 1115 TaxID=1967444 RepID=A0A947DI76_9CYAN|nr:response regulator [Leptothoe spongobia]MBT9317495.1 response regulator [Leptothoe spongobia TAU-MAC 1115]